MNTYGSYRCDCEEGFAVQNGDPMCKGNFIIFTSSYQVKNKTKIEGFKDCDSKTTIQRGIQKLRQQVVVKT
jgi:hypothetical protein